MSTTVIEALENAKVNFETAMKTPAMARAVFTLAMEQLSNAIEALENGKGCDDVIQDHMFGDVKTS